jgi:hypothetical protein
VQGILSSPAEVAKNIAHSSPKVLVLAAVALAVLLLFPGFLMQLIQPRSRRRSPRP